MLQPFEIEVESRFKKRVRADVYLPNSGKGKALYPVIFCAAPYLKSLHRLPPHPIFPFRETGPIQFYLDRGYAFVWADVPGSGRSEGPWDGWSRAEGEAIHDMIEYIAAQPWSNGKLGMTGQSGFCWSSWNVARTRPPHLTTIVAYDGGTDMYREWMYNGGIPGVLFPPVWITTVMLRHQAEGHDIRNGDWYRWLNEIYARPFDDEWHQTRSPYWELDQINIPVLSIGCWGKGPLHLPGNITGFQGVRGPKQLLIEYPPDDAEALRLFAREDFHEREILPWFEFHLKGVDNGIMDKPAVRYFVNRRGSYSTASNWPPEGASKASFYLSGEKSGAVESLNDGSLTEEAPIAADDKTTWSYPDPEWDVGNTTLDKNGRPDHIARVITYTSPPFARDREFTGDGVLVLHASTDQKDLDIICKVSVLSTRPDGAVAAQKVTQGWLRGSHRGEDSQRTTEMKPFHSHKEAAPMEPGKPYELRIELVCTSFLIRAGERLRLEVTNVDSPLADSKWTHWYGLKHGSDTYHHDTAYPSRLMLHELPIA